MELSMRMARAGNKSRQRNKLVIWSSRFETGVAEIDEQHKKFVDLINRLSDAMYSGKGMEMLHRTLTVLEEYADHHFRTEEKLMVLHRYRHAAAHKEGHKAFAGIVRHFRSRLDAGNVVASAEVLYFLREWIVSHIMTDDREFCLALNRPVAAALPPKPAGPSFPFPRLRSGAHPAPSP